MKVKILLSTLLILFCLNYANSQSHISTGQYGCRLVPSSLNTEKHLCPACAANDLKVKQAKAAEEKRRSDAAIAKANADKAARDLAYKKAQKERDEKNKVTEVGLAMPSNTSLPNSTSNTENTNSNSISETPAYTPTYTKQDVTNQVINQAATLAGELLNDWNANYEKKQARLDAEYKQKISDEYDAKRKKEKTKFVKEFLPLMRQAENGDENARLILYFSSETLFFSTHLLTQNWFDEAKSKNNIDVLLYELSFGGYSEENINKLKNVSDMGSPEATLILADWFNKKETKSWGQFQRGGENVEKALKWYVKAAELGSPMAMYRLAMIYKYGVTHPEEERMFRKLRMEYSNSIKNEKLSFEWLSKAALLANFKQTIFSRILQTEFTTDTFTPFVFKELSIMYNKGKVVKKDNLKAKELAMLAENYKPAVENEKFYITERY